MTETLYFAASNGTQGNELWRVDEAGNVSLAADLYPGGSSSRPTFLISYNSELYFNAEPDGGAAMLWKVTANGVVKPVPWPGGDQATAALNAKVLNGKLYFFSDSPLDDIEPCVIGPDGAIRLVTNLNQAGGTFGGQFTAVGDDIYFVTTALGADKELWKLSPDGNVTSIKPIYAGEASSPQNLVAFQETLYFMATGPVGRELYRLRPDGTPVIVRDINPHSPSSSPQTFAVFNGEMYFRATTLAKSEELWKVKADGSVVELLEINPGPDNSSPGEFTEFNGSLYFSATSPGSHRETWRVTSTGDVVQVATINQNGFANPNGFTVFDGALYFVADDGVHGKELWKIGSDGAVSLVADIRVGSVGSSPWDLIVAGGALYFTAATATAGTELWRLGSSGAPKLVADLNAGAASSISFPFHVGVNVTAPPLKEPKITSGDDVEFGVEIKENTTAVTTIKATDPDGGSLRYVLSGPDADLFKISASGVLAFKTAPDFEKPLNFYHGEFNEDKYVVEVSVIDEDGLTDGQTVYVKVNDVKAITYSGSPSANSKTGTSEGDVLKGNGGNDTLKGAGGADTITGGNGHDKLYGGDHSDTLNGGGGNDTLSGGDGKDKLTGGAGKDRFDFATAVSSGIDTITDFSHADDTIALENTIFKALGPSVTSSEFRARTSGHTADSNDHLIYDKSNGTLWYDADSNGTGTAKHIAQLGTASSHPMNLTYADFLII